MTLLLTVLLFELIAVAAAAALLLPLTGHRSGLETEWDDPVPDQYFQAWSVRHRTGQAQPG